MCLGEQGPQLVAPLLLPDGADEEPRPAHEDLPPSRPSSSGTATETTAAGARDSAYAAAARLVLDDAARSKASPARRERRQRLDDVLDRSRVVQRRLLVASRELRAAGRLLGTDEEGGDEDASAEGTDAMAELDHKTLTLASVVLVLAFAILAFTVLFILVVGAASYWRWHSSSADEE